MATRTVRRSATGETLRIDIGDDDPAPIGRAAGLGGPSEAFGPAQLEETPSARTYADVVADAVERIRRSELRKVVLARTIEVDAGRPLDARRLAHRLRAINPDAYTFASTTTTGLLVGASPELLVSRFGREVRSNPLARSAAPSGDPRQDRENAAPLP